MKRTVRTFCAALLLAATLVSCDFGPQGLFSLLEEEVPLNDGSECFKDRTVAFVLTFNGYYYAGIGYSLFRRPVTGGNWESVTVSAAPTAPAGEIYSFSSAATDGTNLYLSCAPVADTILSYDGTTWSPYVNGLSSGEPVQKLLIAPDDTNHRLFAVTSRTTGSSSPYTTCFSLYYDNAGTFQLTGITDAETGCPSSIAYDLTNTCYYIAAGTTIYWSTNADPGGLATYTHVPSGVSAENPVLDVYYDSTNNAVIAACTGYLYKLLPGSSSHSGVFGSADRQLSCTVVVPSNTGGYAAVVGVQSWNSHNYKGYYEYDASLNNASFTSVAPDTDYELITSNSNYVTTLDDYSIDGFYYDSTNGVLFARAVHGGLWSNSWNGSVWSKWNRE